ncbi:MAG: hypothetical protein U0L06_11875 [Agathobacter sp.]|nr:hypothetical protein [Agathobacter sp.]
MNSTKKTLLTANVKSIPSYVDNLAFYDEESRKIVVISTHDYRNSNFDNCTFISKTSELTEYDSLKLMNLNKFISCNPSSQIERYISSAHSERVCINFEYYVSAYIILYKNYKSLETLVENNYINFIDTFIDHCVREANDHPGTICYFKYDIHKIFKLRKTVFAMFEDYINDYKNYMYIYTNQNEYKYTDQQFRVFLRTLKLFSKAQPVAKKRFVETFEKLSNSEAI